MSGSRAVSAERAGRDLVQIAGLRLRCVIGVGEPERRDRSDVVIDVEVAVDAAPAGARDELADAWDYRAPTKAIITHVEESAYRTVEALAAAIAKVLVADHEAAWVRVKVSKPGALRFADVVAVVIERTQADFSTAQLRCTAPSALGKGEQWL